MRWSGLGWTGFGKDKCNWTPLVILSLRPLSLDRGSGSSRSRLSLHMRTDNLDGSTMNQLSTHQDVLRTSITQTGQSGE